MSIRGFVKSEPPPDASWRAMLPCPFCSGKAALLVVECLHDKGYASSACVVCEGKGCNAGGPSIEPRERVTLEAASRIAIAKWNRRSAHQSADWKLRRIAQILNSEFVGDGS